MPIVGNSRNTPRQFYGSLFIVMFINYCWGIRFLEIHNKIYFFDCNLFENIEDNYVDTCSGIRHTSSCTCTHARRHRKHLFIISLLTLMIHQNYYFFKPTFKTFTLLKDTRFFYYLIIPHHLNIIISADI